MATNNSIQHEIINSWSLLAFARQRGKMQVGDFVNKDTGDTFKSCIFTDSEGNRVFVGFSRNLGELTPAQIAANKNDLQVVQFENNNYCLCAVGTNTWQDVNLF